MQNDSDKKFFALLSDAERNEAGKIERDAELALKEGWSEETALAFIRGVMLIRKKAPDMLIPNMIDLALRKGIVSIVASLYGIEDARPEKRTLSGKNKLSGAGL